MRKKVLKILRRSCRLLFQVGGKPSCSRLNNPTLQVKKKVKLLSTNKLKSDVGAAGERLPAVTCCHSKPTCLLPPPCSSDSLTAQRRSLFGLSGHRAGLSCDGPSAGEKPALWPSARPQRSHRPPRSRPLRLMRSLDRWRAERTAAPRLAARVLSCV